MDRSVLHSHCDYCDGKAPMERFVMAAIAAGFRSYGISSHAPLPFETKWTLKKESVDDYIKDVEALKLKYSSDIELYLGLEIDYINEKNSASDSYFKELPLDFRIASIHFVTDPESGLIMDTDGSSVIFRQQVDEIFRGDIYRLVDSYFDAAMRMVEGGNFDFIGHLDKVVVNASIYDPSVQFSALYLKRVNEYLDFIAERGAVIEINTKQFHRGGIFFPEARHFRRIKELKIPVMVNSDAHLPELIDDGREEAFKALSAAGITETVGLAGGEWREFPIIL